MVGNPESCLLTCLVGYAPYKRLQQVAVPRLSLRLFFLGRFCF